MSNERGQAWRIAQAQRNKHRGMGTDFSKWKFLKKWNLLYGRSEKIYRAKQLGFEYPRKNMRKILEDVFYV